MDQDLPVSTSSLNEFALRRRNLTQSDAIEPSTSTTNTAGVSGVQQKEEDMISIKLKYLNDEIKTVNAYLSETIGNFKR